MAQKSISSMFGLILLLLIHTSSIGLAASSARKLSAPSPLRARDLPTETYLKYFDTSAFRKVSPQVLDKLFPIQLPSQQPSENSQIQTTPGDQSQLLQVPSALDLKKPLSEVSFAELPEWKDWQAITQSFFDGRDHRFMKDQNDFSRRPTWLYPDDGCFSRAEVLADRMKALKNPAPKKLFAFGSLLVKTSNSYNGQVDWWYHVVVAFKHKGKVVIFDPAIQSSSPLGLSDWVKKMGNPKDLALTICETHAYGPTDPCRGSIKSNFEQAIKDQQELFPLEWSRLENLGRKPQDELADLPPWKRVAGKKPIVGSP